MDAQAAQLAAQGGQTRQGPMMACSNYMAYPHSSLKDMVTQDADPGGVGTAGDQWINAGNAMVQFQDEVRTAINSSEADWQGAAGNRARGFMADVGNWVGTAGTQAQLAGTQTNRAGMSLQTARDTMPEEVPYDAEKWINDYNDAFWPWDKAKISKEAWAQYDASQEAHQRAAEVVSVYDSNLGAASTMPAFGEPPNMAGDPGENPPKPPPGHVGPLPPGSVGPTGPGGTGGGTGSGVPLPGGGGPGGGPNPPGGGGPGSPPRPGGGTNPPGGGGFPGGGLPGGTNPGGAGPGRPGGGGTGPGGSGGPWGGGGNPGDGGLPGFPIGGGPLGPGLGGSDFERGGAGRGPGTGGVRGFGPGGSGPGGSSGFGGGPGSGGSGGSGPGGVGGRGLGPGGAGALAAEHAAGGGGRGLGAGGRGGAGGPMGGMQGGRGEGDEDGEHQRPAWLVEGDPESLFGTDEMTAPPVIGE
jgi:hypothetical protein